MKKIVFGLVAVSSLVFGAGCGGNYCDDAADAYEGLADKANDCPDIKAALGDLKFSDSDIDECKKDLDNCSSDEKDKLNDSIDCINDLPDCESGKEADWVQKLTACAQKSSGVTCE
ncbi:hypothetical protein JY651_31095 [Pyxidicoccus parkwayensis]|uniref:Lipoprotein n=1 Tax=Pyxidicoccus parkwayensis TaxID=2813578 RepID=A0ABX7NLJ2_9BACT|nr:hypothetical protein [Pyxidicoccus parkwaysis]QSQ19722.1 hypothetical protein JY651_31095 [Pyxidicoccus parkwaysis]